MKRLLALFLSLNLFAMQAPVHAAASGSIVHDPINLIENAATAIETARQAALSEVQIANQIKDYLMQVDKYKQMLKDYKVRVNSLKSMGSADVFRLAKQMGGEVGMYADLNQRLNSAGGNLNQLREMYRWFEGYASNVNMTPEGLFWNETWRRYQAREADKSFLSNVDRALRSTNDDIRKIEEIRASIPEGGFEGEQSLRKAMEVVAVQLNMVAAQNSRMSLMIGESMALNQAKAGAENTMRDRNRMVEQDRLKAEANRAQQLMNTSRQDFERRWNQLAPK